MRYFLFFPSPEPALAGRVVEAPTPCQGVAGARAVQAVAARESGALTGAVGVACVFRCKPITESG